MKVVVVGFKVKEENSVFYRKTHIPDTIVDTNVEVEQRAKELGRLLEQAWACGAEFVSVRFIR